MNTVSSLSNRSAKKPLTLAIVLVLGLLLPVFFNLSGATYPITVCCFMLLYIVAVSGLDIVFGYSGQISLGHAAFFAIGAYTTGILTKNYNVPILFSMLIGAVIAAGVGALLAYPASKLVFHFLSLTTVAFGEIAYQVITHSPKSITGDFNGFRLGNVNLFGFAMDSSTKLYYLCFIFVVIFLIFKNFLVKSKVGRAFTAIRENTHAADGMGINVRKYKIIAFTVSAFYTAFAGGMFIMVMKYVHPDTFQQKQSVLFLTMLLFGGTGSLVGPIIGVVSVQTLVEVLRDFQDYQMIIYGILMLIVIVAIPGGLFGLFKDVIAWFRNRSVLNRAGKNASRGGDSNA